MANTNKPSTKEEKGFKEYGQGGFKDTEGKFKKIDKIAESTKRKSGIKE